MISPFLPNIQPNYQFPAAIDPRQRSTLPGPAISPQPNYQHPNNLRGFSPVVVDVTSGQMGAGNLFPNHVHAQTNQMELYASQMSQERNSSVVDSYGSLLSPVMNRMVSSVEKAHDRARLASFIKEQITFLPKSLDMTDNDALSKFIADLENDASIVGFKEFYDMLARRSEDGLKRHIELVMRSAPILELLNGSIDVMGMPSIGLRELSKRYNEDMLRHTEQGKRQVLPPSYVEVWQVFRDIFLGNYQRDSWIAALGSFDNISQGERSVHEYYDEDLLVQTGKWNRTRLPARSSADNAKDFFIGLNEHMKSRLVEKYPDLVDPTRLPTWDFQKIVRAALNLEQDSTFKEEKLLRERLAAQSSQLANMKADFDRLMGEEEKSASPISVAAVDYKYADDNNNLFGVYNKLSVLDKQKHDAATNAIRLKQEPPVPNAEGKFDFFKKAGG